MSRQVTTILLVAILSAAAVMKWSIGVSGKVPASYLNMCYRRDTLILAILSVEEQGLSVPYRSCSRSEVVNSQSYHTGPGHSYQPLSTPEHGACNT